MSSGDGDSPVTAEEKFTQLQGRSFVAAASGCPQKIHNFSMSELLQDENIKELASKITKHPAFPQMVEQLQKDEIPLWDQQFICTMRQFLENPQLMTIVHRLGNALIQDPVIASILDDISSPDPIEKIESWMLQLREDPSLKPIIDEIEKGGPEEMILWCYEDILKKLGQGTGIGPLGEAIVSFEQSEGVEQAEVGDEFDVRCAASAGIAKEN